MRVGFILARHENTGYLYRREQVIRMSRTIVKAADVRVEEIALREEIRPQGQRYYRS